MGGKRQQRRDSILSQNTLFAVETPEAKLRQTSRGFVDAVYRQICIQISLSHLFEMVYYYYTIIYCITSDNGYHSMSFQITFISFRRLLTLLCFQEIQFRSCI